MAEDFNPFASGAASTMTAPETKPSGDFDPFAGGVSQSISQASGTPFYLAKQTNPDDHWKNLYSGLDGLDARVQEGDKMAFTTLDGISKNPKEDRAAAINQSFIAEKTGMPGQYLARNWEATKLSYAKEEMGLDVPMISDEALYDHIATRIGAKGEPDNLDGIGEVMAWTWKDTLRSDVGTAQRNVSAFMDSISKPFKELSPSLPEHLPDYPFLGAYNPAVAKGTFMDLARSLYSKERDALNPIYEGATKPVIESLESPLGVATLGVGSELNAAAKGGSALAKTAFMGMEGGFTAVMGYNAAQQTPAWWKMMKDPNTPLSDKVKSSASLATSTTFATIGALGLAMDLMPKSEAESLADKMEGKKPSETAELLRQESATATPEAADALNKVATRFDDLAEHEAGVANWETDGGGLTAGGQEKIKAAAVKMPDGQISTGSAHEAIAAELTQGDLGFPPEDAKSELPAGAQEGFVTNTGRFVSREEASVIAQNAEQLTPEAAAEPPKQLHSHQVEFDRPRSSFGQTAMTNAYDEMERVAYGFDEATPTEKRDMTERWVRSGEVMAKDPSSAEILADRLQKNPNMGLTDDQSALLLRYKANMMNALNESADIAYDRSESPERRKEALEQVNELSSKLNTFLDASRARRSEWGREGRWMQAITREDYSFATQENLLRAAKGGAELTNQERAVLQSRIDALQAKQSELEAHISDQATKTHTEAADDAVKKMSLPPRRPRTFRAAESARSSLNTRASEARTRLMERLQRVNDITQVLADSPAILKDMAIIGADKIFSVGLDFTKWSTEMIADLGEKVRPALAQMWDASRDLFHTENRAGLVEELKSMDKDARTKALSSTAQELARSFIEQGVRGRDEVVDKVHGELQKAIPGISKREAMDAISGYGQFRPLTHDEITDQLRDLKGQMQQVAKLEDMAAGQAPKKTGIERRAPSDEERRLQQQVEEEKKKGGYAVTDPEKQLRTSLQAQEKMLTNRIKDLVKEMETGERRPEGAPAPTSPEIDALKDLRDRVAETVDFVTGKREVKPEDRIRAAVEVTTKATERMEAALNEGKVFPESSKRSSPWSPELSKKRKYMAELKAFRKEMQDFERPPKTPQQRAVEMVNKNLKKQISTLEKAITSKTEISKKTPNRITDPEIEKLRSQRDELQAQYDGIFGPKELSNDQRLNIWKAYADRKMMELQDRLANKDFAPKPRRSPPVFDEATNKIRTDLERMKQDFAIARAEEEERLKPKSEKTARGLADVARGLVLSGYHILAKLASFSITRAVETPIAEAIGSVIERTPGIQDIAAKANLESGAQYEGLAKFYTEAAKKGFQDAWDTLTTRKSDIDAELGDFKANTRPPKWYDYFDGGLYHKAEKAVLKRADFELRLEKRTQWAIANGVDVTDPMVKGAMRKEAYDYAQRAILQENNALAKGFASAERTIMGWASDRPMVQREMIALRYLFDAVVTKGIIKTPLNFIGQAIDRSPIGLARAAVYTGRVRIHGVSGLTNAEANMITRLWKLGAIGSAMFLWGMIDATKDPKDRLFGGFYQPGDKRGNDDVQWGKIRLGNTQLPAWITEAPAISAQMGNTFMRVATAPMSKKDSRTKGDLAATVATLASLASSAPIVNPMTQDTKAIESGHADKILWEMVASWIPGFLQDTARDLDGKSRSADNFTDTLKLGIPKLREDVPETKAQKKRDIQQSLQNQ